MSLGALIHHHVIHLLAKKLHIDLAKNMPIPPKSFFKKYMVTSKTISGRNVHYLQQQLMKSHTAIIYLHGGGYLTNFTIQHWRLIDKLMKCAKVDVICPDYPLVPKTYVDSYQMLDTLYDELIRSYPSVILMGDSAGGGFACGFLQYLKINQKTLPSKSILISPWLDVSMSNPMILETSKLDPWLELEKIVPAGKQYAIGNTKHYMVSPIYGDFFGLTPIKIITGTYDILYPDIQLLEEQTKSNQYNITFSIYPKMLHVFPLLAIKEGRLAIQEMIETICEGD